MAKKMYDFLKKGTRDDYRIMLDPVYEYYKNVTKEMSIFGYDRVKLEHNKAFATARFVNYDSARKPDGPLFSSLVSYDMILSPAKDRDDSYDIEFVTDDELNEKEFGPNFSKTIDISFDVIKDWEGDGSVQCCEVTPLLRSSSFIAANKNRIEIEKDEDDDNIILESNECYMILGIMPSNFATPIVRIYKVMDRIWDGLINQGYVSPDDIEELDPEEFMDKYYNAIQLIVEDESFPKLVFDYDEHPEDNENLLWNSLYSTYSSKIFDEKGDVTAEYHKLPMINWEYDFNSFMDYARFEDITPEIKVDNGVAKYHYFNDMGLAVDIVGDNKYTLSYMHHTILEMDYECLNGMWWVVNNSEYQVVKKQHCRAAFGSIATKCEQKTHEIFKNKSEDIRSYELGKDRFIAFAADGFIIFTNDFAYALIVKQTGSSEKSSYDMRYAVTLNDYNKGRTVFTIGIGMSTLQTYGNLHLGTLLTVDLVTTLNVSEKARKPLEISNHISIYNANPDNPEDKSYVIRTYNGLEGKITLRADAKGDNVTREYKVVNLESCFYKNTDEYIYVRDMFGVPTPILLA